MTPHEQAKKIEQIYNEAIAKLQILGQERKELVVKRQDIIKGYVKKLESQKIEAVRTSLLGL